MARQFIKLGFFIGIGGTVTHTNNRKTKRLVSEIDIHHMLVETDSPYMSPEGMRGEINTPMNLKYVTAKMSDELGIAEEDVIGITTENAKRLFGIM